MNQSRINQLIHLAERIEALGAGRLQPTFVNRVTDTQVYIEWQERHATVIFPGSASVTDWRTNARVAKTEWSGGEGRVHRGYAAAYESVGAEIQYRTQHAGSITFAGHSLGGALATLAASLAVEVGDPVVEVVTFGSPRVGNFLFASRYNQDLGAHTIRVVNAGDPVPLIPWLFSTYKHVGAQVYLHRDGSLRIDQPLRIVAAEVAEKLQAARESLASDFISVNAHHITSYIARLKNIAA